MSQNGAMPKSSECVTSQNNHYALLGLHPAASAIEIRRAYRELSKLYHPDTTTLSAGLATAKFQQLNEAYATLSNPERRSTYDLKIGYSRLSVIQAPPELNRPSQSPQQYRSSAYLDPTDRPLSPGEVFALAMLGFTILGCLLLAIAIGLTRGDTAFQARPLQPMAAPQEHIILSPHHVSSTR